MVCYEGVNEQAKPATTPKSSPGTHAPPFLFHVWPTSSLRAPTRNRKGGRGFQVMIWVLLRAEPAH